MASNYSSTVWFQFINYTSRKSASVFIRAPSFFIFKQRREYCQEHNINGAPGRIPGTASPMQGQQGRLQGPHTTL